MYHKYIYISYIYILLHLYDYIYIVTFIIITYIIVNYIDVYCMCVNHKDFCVYEHYKIYKSLWPLLCTLLPSRLWSGLCRFICFRCLAVRMATMSHMSHKSRHSDGLCGFIWCLEEKGHVRRVKRVQNPHPIDPILVRCGKDSRQWLLWHIVTIIPNILGIIGTTYNQQWFWSLLQWVDFWTRDTDFIRSHDVIWTQWVWIFWPKKVSHLYDMLLWLQSSDIAPG